MVHRSDSLPQVSISLKILHLHSFFDQIHRAFAFKVIMTLALSVGSAVRLTPDIRLAQAVSQFEASLSTQEKRNFQSLRSRTQLVTPGVQDVMTLTAEINRHASTARGTRCVGPRFMNILMATQQFVTIGDVIIGGSQNLVACGVWCVVRTSLVVSCLVPFPPSCFFHLCPTSIGAELAERLHGMFHANQPGDSVTPTTLEGSTPINEGSRIGLQPSFSAA